MNCVRALRMYLSTYVSTHIVINNSQLAVMIMETITMSRIKSNLTNKQGRIFKIAFKKKYEKKISRVSKQQQLIKLQN